MLNSDTIIFLGDIFDVMSGPHKEYLEKYKFFFDSIRDFLYQGKKIYYFEGNHDLHLSSLFHLFFKTYKISKEFENIKIIKKSFKLKISENFSLFFSHGDYLYLGNPGYYIYKKFLLSCFAKFLSEKIIKYNWLNKAGEFLSNSSRKRSNKYSAVVEDPNFYNKIVSVLKKEENFRGLAVLGHYHHKVDFSKDGLRYLNSGFFPIEKTFLSLSVQKEGERVNYKFVDL